MVRYWSTDEHHHSYSGAVRNAQFELAGNVVGGIKMVKYVFVLSMLLGSPF